MFVCFGLVEDDPGEGRPRTRAWHSEIAGGSRRNEPFRFLKKELARVAERPTMQEWLERTQQGKPIRAKQSPAQVIRELRDSR